MKESLAYIGIFLLCFVLGACHRDKTTIPGVGVSRELAEARKASIKDLQYDLYFHLPANKKESVRGKVDIHFTLEQVQQVVLDFREGEESVEKVEINGQEAKCQIINEHILLAPQLLRTGVNRVCIDFIAGDQSLNRNEDYLYTLLVPDRARTLFPCFDQPDLKAIYALELDIPESWYAVANGPVMSEGKANGRRQVVFKPTQPLSTYLFSFAAGCWEREEQIRAGRKLTLYYRETDPVKLAQTGVIFDQVFAALHWMEEYTGIPYPFEKYDLVIVPGFQFGGMEHAGAVLYNDKRMFLSEHPSIEEELGRMELIAHETAHMWFGDDVTMVWFNDVWTKEVFANYFAARMAEPHFPQVNHRLNALRRFYPAAYSEDRTQGSNSIRQPLANLNEAGLIYGQIVYNKAPVVMDMLVRLMGEEAFQQGIREYLHTYAYSNATWDGLIRILDRYTTEDLEVWSRAWVDEKGRPEIMTVTEKEQLLVKQRDRWGRNLIWPQHLQLMLVRKPLDGRSSYDVEIVDVNLNDSVVACPLKDEVEYIVPNIDGQGYGYFVMDRETALFCLGNLNFFEDPVARLSVIINLYENYLEGQLSANQLVRGLLLHSDQEKETLIYTVVMGYIKEICLHSSMWGNPGVERALLEKVQKPEKAGRQHTAFKVLSGIWSLPGITEEVYQIWNGEKNYPGLSLSERDEMQLACELAIRMPEQYKLIIEKQAQRIKNPDRLREFAYVAQAVVPNLRVRDSLFYALLVAENRQIEPWVLQMMYFLNHPLRQQQALNYIRPALENLQEIQRTGDIFFPKNWMIVCLKGHASPEAAGIVRQFLDERPDFPPLLKNKILQSADHLFR